MNSGAAWQNIVSLAGSSTAPRQARQAIAAHLLASGLTGEASAWLQVAIGEAVSHAVDHGVEAPEDRITIRYRRSREAVEIGVHTPQDGWNGEGPGVPLVEGPHDAGTVAAMRLHLIRGLVDRITVSRTADGTLVVLMVRLAGGIAGPLPPA